MVAKPAIIKQSEVTRILKGAKAAGVEMSIIVTAGEVRFVPVGAAQVDAEPNALEQWKAKRELRRKMEASRSLSGAPEFADLAEVRAHLNEQKRTRKAELGRQRARAVADANERASAHPASLTGGEKKPRRKS